MLRRSRSVAFAFAILLTSSSMSLAEAVTKGKISPVKGKAKQASAVKTTTAKPLFLWKISKGTKFAYLLGSIHLVPKNFYPLPTDVEQVFAKSDALVLEIDESKLNPLELQAFTMARALYEPGDSIEKHLSSDALKELTTYAESTGQNLAAYGRWRPWFASIMIPIMELKKRGFDEKSGIDKHFLNAAKANDKPVEEVETADFQIRLLSDFNEDLQDKLLLSALRDVAKTDEDVVQMTQAWKSGNPEQMDALVTQDERAHPELQPVMEKLMYDRNIGMADKIETFIESGKHHFVVVGAGHIVGNRGILKLLKDRDYSIEQARGN